MKLTICQRLMLGLFLLAGNALAQLQAYNFYFLPPHNDEWTLGSPYIVWREGNVEHKEPLSVDDRCGWYRYTFSGSVPNGSAWIWLNGQKSVPDDQVGVWGLAEDIVEWTAGRPTPFNLQEKFGENLNVWFDPETSEKETDKGWTPSYPGKDGVCTYKFAAIIYHTNPTKNTSFYAYDNNKVNGIVDGIVRGIVKPQLVNGKMQYSETQFVNSRNQSHEWTEPNFYKAFTKTTGTNVQRCFEMPFTRRGSLWEFDALNFCPDGSADYSTTNQCGAGSGGPIGGFYIPSLMRDIDEYGDYTKDYEDMGGRGALYQGDKGVRPKSCVNMWCFDRGWYGGNCRSSDGGTEIPSDNRSDPNTVGSLDWVTSSTTKEEIDDYMRTICWQPLKAAAIGNDNDRDRGDLYDYSHPVPIDGGTKISGSLANYMCFESAPATFIYKPGQEFLFRGDDDIWVFINNQLVVDVGGNHGPAPGYVKLDTIKTPVPLVPGNEYPINIFFCDRRSTGSNVRISTNMYFSQQNGITLEGDAKDQGAKICLLQDGGNGSCSAALSSDGTQQSSQAQKLCDGAVKGKIEFYIINRKGDDKRLLVDDDGETCKSIGDMKLLCYGGITIDMSTGRAWVTSKDVVGLPGTWYLWAKVKEDAMKPPYPEDMKVATITTSTNVRMAWGDIKDGSVNSPTITNICKNPSIAATGELVPVCFSGGDFSGSSNIFLMDDITVIGGLPFKLDAAGLSVGDSKLNVFLDSLGGSRVKSDTALTIPRTDAEAIPYSGSKAGVLVLWVTGDYDQAQDTAVYKVNVNGRPGSEEAVVKSVTPRLQWIRASKGDSLITSGVNRQNKGSKWNVAGNPASGLIRDENKLPAPVWVGEFIKLHIRALRANGKATCTTCNYPLKLTAEASAYKGAANSNTLTQKDGSLIVSSGLNIKNGEAELNIAGKMTVIDPYFASITVRGVGIWSDAVWDSLSFQEPPTPLPDSTKIFDVNGDGIGDSLVIFYNRGFHPDSLPNAIEVQWDKDTTITYTILSRRSWDDDKQDSVYADSANPNNKINKAENLKYWMQYLRVGASVTDTSYWQTRRTMTPAERKALKDTIILRRGPSKTTSEDSVRFSKGVLTRSESGKIANWVSFETGEGSRKKRQNISLSSSIEDKIPAIIIGARYLAGEIEGCGLSANNPCRDRVTLEFSEPIIIDTSLNATTASNNEIKNTFAYMLRDIDQKFWDILSVGFLPEDKNMKYRNSRIERPDPLGNDSVVELTFARYRDGISKSGTPMPGDSVKFAALGKGYAGFVKNILVDLKGNSPNPKEIGRQIEGRKPFNPEKIPIGSIDPNYPDYIKDIIKTLTDNGSSGDFEDSLFNKNRPIELLPVPPDWTIKDVLREYPGTIGILLNPDIFNELAELEGIYGQIFDGDITLYPKAYFHTNLGTYVADRLFPDGVKCNDPIFPRNEKTRQPSCRESRSKLYIAWDMKDMKGRFVGAGAYVGLYDFRWEVFIKKTNATVEKEKIERKVEMHGVKRVKRK